MNTRRMNRLEELGRVDAEKADTRKGKRNLREEKSRIVSELKAKGGKVGGRRRPMTPEQKQKRRPKSGLESLKDLKKARPKIKVIKVEGNKIIEMKKGGRVGMGIAKRGGGCVR